MAARVGGHPDGLENFNPEDQAVDEWLERLEVFLELQSVTTEADKVNALLHFSGPTVYQVLRQACLPAKPKSKTFEELCNLMRGNFESHPLARSFRRKLSDESVVQFANALRVLVSKCDYGADHLETVLVDTFTRNVRSAALQAKFDKAKPEEISTLSKCLELARLYESFEEAKQSRTSDVVCNVSSRGRGGFQQRGRGGPTQRGGGAFQSRGGRGGSYGPNYGAPSSSRDRGGGAGAATASVSSQRGGFQRRPLRCYACGDEGHKAFECRCRNYVCSVCHQQGHIKKACPTVIAKCVQDEEGYDGHVVGEVEDMSHLMEDVYISKRVFSVDVERYREIVVSECAEVWDHVDSDEFNVEYEALKWCQEIETDMSCCGTNDSVGERFEYDACDARETVKSASKVCDNVVKCVESLQSRECFGHSLLVRMKVNGKDVAMEVDNGSRHSLMTKVRFNRLFPDVQVRSTTVRVASLSGHSLCAGGESRVKVFERGKDWSLRLIICDNNDDFVPLLGREWLDAIVPEWRQMLGFQQISDESKVKSVVNVKDDRISAELEQLKGKYPSVFSEDGSSCIEGFTASVVLKPNARPVFHKEYVVPYSEREKVTTVLRNKIQDGRYIRNERAVWASPVWPVPKPHSGEIRVVHDYKRTVNPNIVVDHYPLPLPIDIFNAMKDCKYYCVLDCADAFMQLKLDEASQEILVLNTCIGLLRPTRLPYGLSSASACFQSVIDQVLVDLPRVRAYIDDIVVGGESLELCRKNLYDALSRLEKHKVRVRFDKMQLYRAEIEILGYVLGFNVYRASPKKVSAIVNCAKPKNQGEVHSYLGMVNFYARFLPNASSLFKPLYDLLQKDARWEWDESCEKAFELSKTMLIESKALVLYDPTKELVLMTDASPVGVGGVLSMKVVNQELPVEFMSKMLTITQQRYSQLEREALAIIVALQKYHKYLWGRKFKIVTDNMPLKAMFAPTKTTPKVAAQRLQRWSVILGNYDYEIEYRKSSQMGPADMLSRLPVNEYAFDEICNFVVDLPELPVSCESVMVETESDPQLSVVKMYVMKGWPDACPAADLKVYFDVRYALSVESDCVMLGDRVVVPPSLQKRVLENLHQGHPGIVRMKLRARSLMWWPSITMDIESYVADCEPCSQSNFKAASTAQVPWTPTSQPWERIHIEFFFLNREPYLLCVDSFSKWVEVWKMGKTNATAVIEKLSLCFSTWGLPLEIVSDNGPPFNSVEFIDFCTRNLIVVSKSAPYHPQGNGQGEKFVGIVKMGLEKALKKSDGVPLPIKLSNYLLAIRTTPSTVTKKCPSDLMLGFEPKTLVNAIKPNLRKYVPQKRHFQVGDVVKVKLSQKHEVFLARIIKVTGPTLYHVEVFNSDKIYQVSVNQLQLNGSNVKTEDDKNDTDVTSPVMPKPPIMPNVLVHDQDVPNCDQVPVNDVSELHQTDESVKLRDQPSAVASPGPAAVNSPKPLVVAPNRELRDRKNIRAFLRKLGHFE